MPLKIALSMTKGVTAEVVRKVIDAQIPLDEFFDLPDDRLSALLGGIRILKSDRDEALFNARKELEFVNSKDMRVISLLDAEYPYRLAQCYDAPVLLYVTGNFTFPPGYHYLSFVGTRRMTHYGANFCKESIAELARMIPDLVIVSGLALGIDGESHKAALKAGIPTVAVVAHGLSSIYPPEHYQLARNIIEQGGAIISEYPHSIRPFRNHFLERNRIVAGLSDGTVVVESPNKGGAMSTARLTFEYDRELMALPGAINMPASEGTNTLIRRGMATLVTSARQIVETMGWERAAFSQKTEEKPLFPELEPEVLKIYEVIKSCGSIMTFDEIHAKVGGRIAEVMSALSDMEADGLITKYPGNRFVIN